MISMYDEDGILKKSDQGGIERQDAIHGTPGIVLEEIRPRWD